MSFLRNTFEAVGVWFGSKRRLNSARKRPNQPSVIVSPRKRLADDISADEEAAPTAAGRKRRKRAPSDKPIPDIGNEDKRGSHQGMADAEIMPPPSPPERTRRVKTRPSLLRPPRSVNYAEDVSQATRSSRIRSGEALDEYDMEEARRRAAATQLPENSGIWEEDERQLFYHLSYRGFEPLLPYNWMHDFPTLPISIFSTERAFDSLIQCHMSSEFRAIRALDECMSIGAALRDRALANPDARNEPVLRKVVVNYIKWALQDYGLPVKRGLDDEAMPVYTIASLKPGETVQDCMKTLALKMQNLARLHQRKAHPARNVENGPAVTNPDFPAQSREAPVPVVYGLAICRCILGVFTLNSHAYITLPGDEHDPYIPDDESELMVDGPPTPDATRSSPVRSKQRRQDHAAFTDIENLDADSGLRFIAHFDFGNAANDVWNALVIAIVAMQIRGTMAQLVPDGVRDKK